MSDEHTPPPASSDDQPTIDNALAHPSSEHDATFLGEVRAAFSMTGDDPDVQGYTIQREISRGGQGIVYEAMQTATHRRVALKVLLSGAYASPRQRVRFEREAELVAALKHPDIVTVWDSGVTETGCAWMAMEFVDGVPLTQWLESSAPTDRHIRRRVVSALLVRIAKAVAAAHRRGIIHRDLKPANILIDTDGAPHVLDFGLAKPIDADAWSDSGAVTAAGEFMGTLSYAAPEQVSGDPDAIDARTDVWALGVMLYEALLGVPPLTLEGGLSDVVETIRLGVITTPRQVDPALDRDLETILLRSLDADPDRRTQSPADLARDLDHWLAGRPIEARRDETWYVVRKFLRRHWIAVSGAVASIAILIAFAITMWVMYQQATDANNRLRGTLGMTWDVLATADAENPDQPLAASNLSEMMQRWSSLLEAELAQWPEIAAQMQIAVGRTMLGWGHLEEASAALEAAARVVDVQQPSLLAADLLHETGRVYYKQARWEDAAKAYRLALEHRQALLGIHDDTATSWHHLGATLRHAASAQAATDAMQAALGMRRELLAMASNEDARRQQRMAIANGLNSLSIADLRHAPQRAIGPLKEALSILIADSTDVQRDWRVASLRHNVGSGLLSLGRLQEASDMLEQALETKQLQGNHLQIANTQYELARLALLQNQYAPAAQTLERALAVQRSTLPREHPSLRRSELLHVDLLIAAKHWDDARAALQALDGLAEGHLELRQGRLAAGQGNMQGADALLQQAWTTLESLHGTTAPSTRAAAHALATLWQTHDANKAELWQALAQPPTSIEDQ